MLLYWLPLNGNLNNNGVSTLSPVQSSTLSYASGKMGISYSSKSTYIKLPLSSFPNGLSIAFWVKPNSPASWSDIFSIGENNNRFETNGNGHYMWFSDNNTIPMLIQSGADIFNMDNQEWYHVCMTADGNNVKFYLNGTFTITYPQKDSFKDVFGSKLYINVAARINGSCNYFGYFNDFRVYDNAISEKEIKILSQGLFIHYPLNQQEKEVNLCPNSYVNETSNAYGFAHRSVSLTAGKTYTLSVNGRVVDGEGTLSTYIYKSDWSQSNNRRITDTNDVTFSMSFTPNTTGNYSIGSYSFLKQGTAGGNVHVNWYKLIEGTNPSTKWSPAMSDTINWGNIEYDTSGYGNNLSVEGTIINENDSPRYDGCYNFNQTGYLKKEGLNLYADSFTICYWVKIPSSITAQHFIFGTFDSWTNNGVGAWRDSSSELGYDCIMRSTSESTYGSFGRYTVANIPSETWAHIAYVYTGTQIRTYKNGSLVDEKTYGSSGQCYMPNLYLGNSKFGNITTENDESSMSDFRLYTTALSEQDIKELYQSPISITDNGVLITQGEFKEE